MADVAQRLGITTHSLFAWKLKFGRPDALRKAELDQSAEVRRLKAELKRMTEERDILKKAAADSTGRCNTCNRRGRVFMKLWPVQCPAVIQVGNGPEFVRKALDAWAHEHGVRLQFIRPGKPVENAHIESFNGHLREECLNQHAFRSLDDARKRIEA